MKPDELLSPRYKLVADYPGNSLTVGAVIVPAKTWKDFTIKFWCESNDKYPHLFKLLQWWEERKPEEMPEYVRCIKTPDQIIQAGEVFYVVWNANGGKVNNGPWIFPYTNCFEPATEEDYYKFLGAGVQK